MKCPICGHEVRPSKKVPGKYLCDNCRKRFPESAVLPDNEVDKETNEQLNISESDSEVPGSDTHPPKKKNFFSFIIPALIIIAVIAVFLFFYLKSSGSTSAPDTSQKEKDSLKTLYQQGETASYNGINITLDNYVESEGDDWSVPAEGNEFMFVHMTITNHSTSDNDLVISSMASFESYCDDAKLDYSAAAFTALATTSDQPKLDGTIAPGETLEGYLSLEVPLTWSSIEIQYTDKVWSEDAIHFQIKRQ